MILALVGAVSGAIGAMGIGGGIVLIPVLTAFFDLGQRSAQFVNLVYFVPLSVCALFVHAREGRVDIKKALFMILGGVPGALLGAWAASAISVDMLRRIFGLFLICIGGRQCLMQVSKHSKKQ